MKKIALVIFLFISINILQSFKLLTNLYSEPYTYTNTSLKTFDTTTGEGSLNTICPACRGIVSNFDFSEGVSSGSIERVMTHVGCLAKANTAVSFKCGAKWKAPQQKL